MLPDNNQTRKTNSNNHRVARVARLAALLTSIAALGIVAAAAYKYHTVDASTDYVEAQHGREWGSGVDAPVMPVNTDSLSARNSGSGTMVASSPLTRASPESGVTQSHVDDSASATVYVWAARLVVGTATDSVTTYTGYIPDHVDQGRVSSLNPKTFTYGDVDYTIQALFLQQVIGGFQQLVFHADQRLPDHLILYVGNDSFSVSESVVMGSESNMHAWRLDEDLGWTAGQVEYPVLLESTGDQIEFGTMQPSTVPGLPDAEDG